MLYGILLTAQILICLVMGGLILIQRSEGGALGMGGGPSGFMSARGTGNLLTTLTGWFAVLFFVCSILLTVIGNRQAHIRSAVDQVDTNSLTLSPLVAAQQSAAAAAASASAGTNLPLANLPIAGAGAQTSSATPVQPAAPAAQRSANAPVTALPVRLPAFGASSSASPTADQIAKAKASVFRNASSSAAPAPSAPASSAPVSSTSPAPQ